MSTTRAAPRPFGNMHATRPSLALAAIVVAVFVRSPLSSAQPFGQEFRVNTYTTGTEGWPRVATDAGGNFVVVWTGRTSGDSSYAIVGQRYAGSGAPLGAEFRVNVITTGSRSYPSVSSAPSGLFVVAWQRTGADGVTTDISGQRYAGSGTPLDGEFLVNATVTGLQKRPRAASRFDGDFVIVWESRDQDGSSYGVFGQRYASSGAPLGPEFRVNAYTTYDQRRPSVAGDPGGGFVVVWEGQKQDGAFYGVFGQRFLASGAPLGLEFRVNVTTSGSQRSPGIVCLAGGGFVVIWESSLQDGSSYGVFARRYALSGAPVGGEFLVNSTTTDAQRYPAVASVADGFVVAWQSTGQDDAFGGVFARRFDGAAAPLGGEFRVNTFTTDFQRRAAVAGDVHGRFVVVWESRYQDGSGAGVFGQRFCPPLASVTIAASGTTTVCTTSTGGTASVTDDGGGPKTHQWGYRVVSGGATTPLSGETGTSYLIDGADFPGVGFYYVVCATFPECGASFMVSNEILVVVTSDPTAPVVTPPPAATTTQTLCM